MIDKETLSKITSEAVIKDQYLGQIARVEKDGAQSDQIAAAVQGVLQNLPVADSGSLVVYGDPQSGKTEMMICLTGALLDAGHRTIIHLMNDSVDLLAQNLGRFKLAGLAPAPRNSTDLINSPLIPGQRAIIFCKKNGKDLPKLIDAVSKSGPVVVIDDEADYATPNAKVNQNATTKINKHIDTLLGKEGKYIGVTATPARLNLNNTFKNKTETWVNFGPHSAYTGQDHFFPQATQPEYRLKLLTGPVSPADAQAALARFLVTVAFLNTTALSEGKGEENYSFLVHTSGKTDDHKADRKTIESAMASLVEASGAEFADFLGVVYQQSKELYPDADTDALATYVVKNASRNSFVVLNSQRDKASAGDKPTLPTCPFTVIIGGNIVSRGVTFQNLLSMFFTRDVKTKLQQDTYIQRARMFGARGKYLKHFELTIPSQLYEDWHRCFVFHRLSLQAIKSSKKSPVWLSDPRISIAASASIDRSTVDLNRGEMSFQMFDCPSPEKLDQIVAADPRSPDTLAELAKAIGDALPPFLVEYVRTADKMTPGTLAIHESSSVAGYKKTADTDPDEITRRRGFIGNPQLEIAKFPNAVHHVKILYNAKGRARVFYKNTGGVQFVQNLA